jgi:hypothetical protein
MEGKQKSPKIQHLSWGRLEVEGHPGVYKDAKLYPGGSREWDWNETGTRHDPGVQPADAEELLSRGAEVVVLSRGINERLQVQVETVRMLEEKGVEVHILQSEEAVRLYNERRETEAVGALIHSTC